MADLKLQIKTVLTRAMRLQDTRPEDIADDVVLFGKEGMGFDSVDALELAVELEREFDILMPDDAEHQDVYRSVNTLATWIADHR